MNNNFSLKFNLRDIIAGITGLVLIIATIISVNLSFKESNLTNEKVEIYYHGEKLNYNISFSNINSEETIILKKTDYPDLLGDFKILINKEKGIKVEDITCPNHYCEEQGWVKKINYPITCLPNDVYIIILSNNTDGSFILG